MIVDRKLITVVALEGDGCCQGRKERVEIIPAPH